MRGKGEEREERARQSRGKRSTLFVAVRPASYGRFDSSRQWFGGALTVRNVVTVPCMRRERVSERGGSGGKGAKEGQGLERERERERGGRTEGVAAGETARDADADVGESLFEWGGFRS
jgi:hypothetical protein